MPNVIRKKISNEEAAALGLPDGSGASRRKISNDEASALGVGGPQTAPEGPSLGRSIVEGALQGGSYGFGDEIQGALGAVLRPSESTDDNNIFRERGAFGGAPGDYSSERDAARRDRDAAAKAHPTAYNVSQLVGALLAPGPKAGKTIGSFVKTGARAGGAYGLGASDADLTKGDAERDRAAGDTLLGAGLGGLGGAAGGLINKGLQWGASRAADFGRRAFERGAEKAQKPIDTAINSTRGVLGGEVAAGSRGVEVAEKAATDAAIPEELSRAAADALDDPAIAALKERVIRSQLGSLHGRLPRIEKAQTAFNDALEAGSPEARKAATEALMSKSPMTKALLKNLARIGLPAVGYGVDQALGGSGAVGGALGLVTGQIAGRPMTLLTNAARSPQFQRSAAQLGARALGETAPGAMAGAIGEQAGNPRSTVREKLAPYLELLGEKPDE